MPTQAAINAWFGAIGIPPDLIAKLDGGDAPRARKAKTPDATKAADAAASADTKRSKDTDAGRISWFASKQAEIGPLLDKAVQLYTAAAALEAQLDEADEAFAAAAAKIGPLDAVLKDVGANTNPATNDRARTARAQGHSGKGAKIMLRLIKQNLAAAELNLTITKDDIKEAENEQKAEELITQANEIKETCEAISKGIDLAASAADPAEAGPKIAGMIVEAFGSYEASKLQYQADLLRDEAKELKADDAWKKLQFAHTALEDLGKMQSDAQAEAADAAADADDDWVAAEDSFDGSSPGTFRFSDLKDAIAQAKSTQALAQKTVLAASSALNAAFQLTKAPAGWQADPGEDAKTVAKMMDDSKGIMEAAIFTRDKIPPVLKTLQTAHAGAQKAVAAAHPGGKKV